MEDVLNLGPDWYSTEPPERTQHDIPLDAYDQWAQEQEEEEIPTKLPNMHRAVEEANSKKRARGGVDPEWVQETVRGVLASLNGRSADEVQGTIERVGREKAVLAALPDKWQTVLDGVLEVLAFTASALGGVGIVDFDYLPGATMYSDKVADELKLLRTHETVEQPVVAFEALVETIQAEQSRRAALKLAATIEAKASAKERMARFRDIVPPTRQRVVVHNDWAKTAAEWEDAAKSRGNVSDIILTSGYPTLDLAASGSGEHPGLIKPGEFWVGAAGTGHGKSAFTRRVFTAMLDDLVNGWGYRDARAVLFFTEEEAPDVIKAAGLGTGQTYHHLARNATLAKIGQSRQRMQMVVWDIVKAAEDQALATGADIREFLLWQVIVDYVNGIKEQGENADTEGVANTADWLMRGLAAFDHEMMGAISGLTYQQYTGRRWPDGLSDHRVAVFALSQLRKEGTDHNVFYRKGRSTDSDFVVSDNSGRPLWTPLEDDYAIPNRSDLRGSGVLLNHATGLLFFHRSKPMSPVRKNAEGKVVGLDDTRARILVPKARKSVSMPYVPMRFDSQPSGHRGQFYDDLAWEHCVQEGRMPVRRREELREGDPIMPERPPRSPWNVKY